MLMWDGEEYSPGSCATITVDTGELFNEKDGFDPNDTEDLEKALRLFGQSLKDSFEADHFMTEQMSKEFDAWAEAEMAEQ